jgi:ureidoglycolate lyase
MLEEMERHPLACQLFMPLGERPFPVVVAATPGVPRLDQLQAFISNGRQGVVLKPGTWHHHQLSLEVPCDYLVIERLGEEGNLDLVRFETPVMLYAGA